MRVLILLHRVKHCNFHAHPNAQNETIVWKQGSVTNLVILNPCPTWHANLVKSYIFWFCSHSKGEFDFSLREDLASSEFVCYLFWIRFCLFIPQDLTNINFFFLHQVLLTQMVLLACWMRGGSSRFKLYALNMFYANFNMQLTRKCSNVHPKKNASNWFTLPRQGDYSSMNWYLGCTYT